MSELVWVAGDQKLGPSLELGHHITTKTNGPKICLLTRSMIRTAFTKVEYRAMFDELSFSSIRPVCDR